jgi:hypothetical protein
MFELFEKYMISPFYEQESLPGYINTAAMFLFGTYLIIVIIYTASLFFKRKETDSNRQVMAYLSLQSLCLLLGTMLSILIMPLIFLIFAVISYYIPPYDEGIYQFAKKHGFEYAHKFEFFKEMEKHFPNGYKNKDFKQYIDWDYIAGVRKKIIKSYIYHFAIWIIYIAVIYSVK